jgi:hypothetical protein
MDRYNTNSFVLGGVESSFMRPLSEDKILTPEQANEEWGIDGVLQFQEPISIGDARRKSTAVHKDREREAYIARAAQNESLLGKVGNLGLALASMATDVTNYAPVGTGVFKGLRALGLAKAGSLTAKVLKSPIGHGAVDAMGGTLLAQPAVYMNHQNLALDYGLEDALLDIGTAGVFGTGTGTLGSMVRTKAVRGKRTARLADFSERLANAKKDVDAAQVAMGTQLTEEARVDLTNYLTAVNKDGGIPEPEMIRAILKAGSIAEDLTPNNSTTFLNNVIGKVDLDDLRSPDTRRLLETARTSSLIPENFFSDPKRVFDLTAKGRGVELPGLIRTLAEKLGSLEGVITARDFGDLVKNSGLIDKARFEGKGFFRELAGLLGEERVKASDTLTAKQVFALVEELEAKEVASKAFDDPANLQALKEFQSELKLARSNTDIGYDTYKSRFRKSKKFISENPEYRKLKITDLQKLNPSERKQVMDFLKFFDEANPTESQLAAALRGKDDAIRELYQQAQLNNIKNSISEKDALDIISRKIAKGNFAQEVAISPAARLGNENIKIADDGFVHESFINEEIEALRKGLGEEDIAAIEADIKSFEESLDRKVKGIKRSIDCVFGG